MSDSESAPSTSARVTSEDVHNEPVSVEANASSEVPTPEPAVEVSEAAPTSAVATPASTQSTGASAKPSAPKPKKKTASSTLSSSAKR
ncbi:hypothetical protein GGH14_002258, partial [Coemansia sp. RSA 370]